jgi:DNA-binding NtrC family response regulator
MRTEPTSVLVADDEESMRFFLVKTLRRAGYSVTAVENGRQAVDRVVEDTYDVLLVDLKMPGMDGIAVLEAVREISPDAVVLIMTGHGSVENALEAMKRGAADYITKPFHRDAILLRIERSLERRRTVRENLKLRHLVKEADEAPRRRRVEPIAEDDHGVAGLLAEKTRDRGGPEVGPDRIPELREAARLLEWLYVDEALRRHGGNVSAAARQAGISRPNFHRKLRELGFDTENYRKRIRRDRE